MADPPSPISVAAAPARRIRRWAVTPALLAFLGVPALRSRPHTAYRALVRADRAHRSPFGVWVLSGHPEVAAALRHPDLGSDERKADFSLLRPRRLVAAAAPSRPGPFLEIMPNLILFRDPPDHTRLRSLVQKAFTPRAVARLEDRIRDVVDEHLDRLAPRRRMDLMAEFAYPVPALVICELLGVPLRDGPFISRHAPALAARLDPDVFRGDAVARAADQATVAMVSYLDRVIAERRANPGEDLLSGLISAQEGDDRLSHDELVTMVILLLIAGHETTANLLGNGMVALLRHPAQLDRLRSEPALDATAVEELLRYDGPVQMAERIALTDVDLASTPMGPSHLLTQGRIVALCIAAANRDPSVFTDPERLDLGRQPNPHLSFGSGPHFCVGASLARLEARIAVRGLVDRLPGVALAERRLRWRRSFTIRGLERLDLEWKAG